jgi:hypothetical protein
MSLPVAEAISAGLAALARMQPPDGGFPLYVAKGAARGVLCDRLFSTAYVMLGAGGLLPPDNIARAIAFIRARRRADGLWVYDPSTGLPPDSDSTACALAALALHGEPSDVSGGADLLRSFWWAERGHFRTWNTGVWSRPEHDDVVVNCNVAFALRLLGVPVTAAEAASILAFVQGVGISRYYCAPSTIAHAACRAGFDLAALPPAATARPPPDNLIGAVQWLSGMPNDDDALKAAVLDAQRADGSWPAWAWVTGEARPKPYWASAAITTALAIEALKCHTVPTSGEPL